MLSQTKLSISISLYHLLIEGRVKALSNIASRSAAMQCGIHSR